MNMIKNLSQLKKALAAGRPFVIEEHYIRPDYKGQCRVVQKMQTNGMYTGIYKQPDAEVSKYNYGKGSWMEFGKASDWAFNADGSCEQAAHGRPVWKIRVLDVA